MPTLIGGKDAITGSVDPKLGLVAIAIQWHAETLDEAISGAIPSIGADSLRENQPRKFSRRAAGPQAGYDVTSVVEGCITPATAAGEEFEIQGTTSEDKIETHPELNLLLEAYEGTIDPQTGRAKWPQELAGPYLDPTNPMHGVEAYLVPALVWTRKWVSQQLDLSYIRSLGTIDTPPGNPPELDGNRNWLLARVTGQWRGNIWMFTASWMLSGPRGFVAELYRKRA